MKLQPIKFGIAWAASGAVFSLFWGAFLFSMPARSMYMDQHMMRPGMGNWGGSMTLGAVLLGIILWSVFAGLFGSLIAVIYNAQIKDGSAGTE